MGNFQKVLLFIVLFVVVALIILTWGSIGSAVLTLGLLLAVGYIVIHHIMENRDPDDFNWEG